MKFIFAKYRRSKAKVYFSGKTSEIIPLVVALSKTLCENVEIEKDISKEKAQELVIECIKDGIKIIN